MHMSQIFCVRADFGKYTDSFVGGGYVAVDWVTNEDLGAAASRDDLEDIHSSVSPNETVNVMAGQQMDQVARFLFDINAGDFVVTPSLNTEKIYYGRVCAEPNYYFYEGKNDKCPFPHRKRVIWSSAPIPTRVFSAAFQNSLHSSLSVFPVNQQQNFIETIESSAFEQSLGQPS
jgi:predicted Mrr-cat superfamily restriction endonuclease